MTWLNPRDLWMYENAQGGTDAPKNTIAVSQYVVLGNLTDYILPHALGTANLVPAFMPSWNTSVWPLLITDKAITVRFSVPSPNKSAALDYSVSRGTPISLTPGVTSYTITHNANDPDVVILVSVNWNASVKRTIKTATQLTVEFNVEAPNGAKLYWGTHDEPTDVLATADVVDGDAERFVLEHETGIPFAPMFVLPNWNTTYRWLDKGENEATIVFSNPAPSGGGLLDWRVKPTIARFGSTVLDEFGNPLIDQSGDLLS